MRLAPCSETWLRSQVQKLIERCLELYMSQEEIVTALKMQANIEQGLTNLGAYNSVYRPLVCCTRSGPSSTGQVLFGE